MSLPNPVVIGEASLYEGDCLKIMPALAGLEFDLLLTDMPYGATDCAWDKPIDLAAYWPLAKKTCKQNAAHVHFCQMPFAGRLWESNKKDFRYDLVYKKPRHTGFLNANRMPLRGHELIFVFYQSLPTYNPQKTKGKPAKRGSIYAGPCYRQKELYAYNNPSGLRHPLSILTSPPDPAMAAGYNSHKRPGGLKPHNTQKNVYALEWLIRSYTNPGDTVFDPFMGQASTGVAALASGRKFIGIELDGGFFDNACQRLENAIHAGIGQGKDSGSS